MKYGYRDNHKFMTSRMFSYTWTEYKSFMEKNGS